MGTGGSSTGVSPERGGGIANKGIGHRRHGHGHGHDQD
jgi:hypothetical protein